MNRQWFDIMTLQRDYVLSDATQDNGSTLTGGRIRVIQLLWAISCVRGKCGCKGLGSSSGIQTGRQFLVYRRCIVYNSSEEMNTIIVNKRVEDGG